MTLRSTLLADGVSDRSLIPILTWALIENGAAQVEQPALVDNARLPKPPSQSKLSKLAWRMKCAWDLYPCDLLFVHRDAEKEPMQNRVEEIRRAATELVHYSHPVACIVPVRMQEAWLLFSEEAIRRASSNPNGRMPLNLPRLKEIEDLPDPKETLAQLLRTASGLSGRRLQKLSLAQCTGRVVFHMEDFSPLRELSAFQALEAEIRQVLKQWKT